VRPQPKSNEEKRERLAGRSLRLVGPVLLAAVGTALVFASIDRSHPSSLLSAVLALALLGVVLTRQVVRIVALQSEAETRTDQLAVMTEVVSILNSSPSVGSGLGPVLDRLLIALEAVGGAVWVPSAEVADRLVQVESRGLPPSASGPELLDEIRRAIEAQSKRLLHHRLYLPREGCPDGMSYCLTVAIGHQSEEFGYLTLIRWDRSFRESDGAILDAVGSDIGGALRSVRLISEARRVVDLDPVTGLWNHRSAYRRLSAEVTRHSQASRPLSVLLMDLDNFKLFNHTYGHQAGDEVLKRVTSTIRKVCRDEDTLARYGADEFLAILPDLTLKQAIRQAEKIQTALAKERFRCENSASLPIGFSYGVAAYPEDSTDPIQLVSIADRNLYRSKIDGGGRITGGDAKTENALAHVNGFDLLWALVVAIDNKDGYTRKHSEDVTEYSIQIARALELDEAMMETLHLSGILHDVGKLGVPDAILRKPGRLTPEEFAVMQQHPVFGALIVGALPGMDEVVLGVRHHHERYDGRGYPDGLAGKDIPLIGRIMAVADAYSAMTTSRPYRKGLEERQALADIRANLGSQFDPEIGEIFVRLREQSLADAPPVSKTPRRRTAAIGSRLSEINHSQSSAVGS
jgi:diguanylate cyclase (GGDEF)-like protein